MKELTFKYNKTEMFALQDLYERTVCEDTSRDINDRLLIALLVNVYKKIRTKTIEVKDKYQLKYKPEEAIAFVLYFKDVEAMSIYEQRLIDIVIAQTDRNLL